MGVGAPRHVAVVGGGIAGLAAAYTLDRLARQASFPLRLTVLEASERWGGKIRTERSGGYVLEAGPDTFVSTKPWGVALCRDLGLEDRLQAADMDRRKVFVVFGGRLVELPDGLAMMVPSRLAPMIRTPLLTPLGKARLVLDWFLPSRRGDADESVGALISRRLGRQAYERLIEPLMSGIYAGDGDRLSLLSTFPYLREWEQRHGSLARGALRSARPDREAGHSPPRRSIFLTLTGGLGEIIEALVTRLSGADLRLAAAVQRIDRAPGGYRLTGSSGVVHEADAIVLATPAFEAARMLGDLDPLLAEQLRQIEYVSTATVTLAFRESELPRPLDGHGYVIPRVEGRQALACTWTSTKFPHRAPAGHALLRVFIGRAGRMDDPNLDEESLIEIARQELADTLGIRSTPILARVARWPRSMPQYNLGHPERLRAIAERLGSLPGLRLAGAAYNGIGIPDCIRSGERAAAEVFEVLKAGRSAADRILPVAAEAGR